MGDMDDVQNEFDKYTSDNKSNGVSFQTIYYSKLLGLYYNSAILKQIIYVSHLRLWISQTKDLMN